MAFKLVFTLAFLGIASAHVAPLTLIQSSQLAPLSVVHVKEDPLPQYTYTYGVHDSISGDSKTATETRNGNAVKGEYSLNDADGFKRTVSYTADAQNGFQAVVDRKPIADISTDIQKSIAAKSPAAPIATPLVIRNLTPLNITAPTPIVQPSAPLLYYTHGHINSAPLTYSAPIISSPGQIVYSQPIISSSAPVVVSHSVIKPGPLILPLTHSGPYYYAPSATFA